MEYYVKFSIYLVIRKILQKDKIIMNTQFEKNNRYIAAVSYRARSRRRRLRGELIVFFSVLSIICAGAYIIISALR